MDRIKKRDAVESEHAPTLRSLEFRRLPDNEPNEVTRVQNEIKRKLGRQETTLPKPTVLKRREPFFIYMGSNTIAKDEMGGRWIANTRVDLSPFGFKDATERSDRLFKEYTEKQSRPEKS